MIRATVLACSTLFIIAMVMNYLAERTPNPYTIDHAQDSLESKHLLKVTEMPKRAEATQAEPENATRENMTIVEIDAGIEEFDREIITGDYVAKANNGTLSNQDMNYFRMLLKKRDELFAAKAELLLSELQFSR